MSGIWTKKDQEWWNDKENQFIFNFNLIWTSRNFWDRTPENVQPREEALRKLYRESCRHEPLVGGKFADIWQKCLKCDGQGLVSKPPFVVGDVNAWNSTSAVHTCDVCNGSKIINSYNFGGGN